MNKMENINLEHKDSDGFTANEFFVVLNGKAHQYPPTTNVDDFTETLIFRRTVRTKEINKMHIRDNSLVDRFEASYKRIQIKKNELNYNYHKLQLITKKENVKFRYFRKMRKLRHVFRYIKKLSKKLRCPMNFDTIIYKQFGGYGKKRKNTASQPNKNDLVVVNFDVDITKFGYFSPISISEKLKICKKYDFNYRNSKETIKQNLYLLQSEPSTTYLIEGDGSCFFRAVSQSITNDQNNHLKIREMVINNMSRPSCIKYLKSCRNLSKTDLEYHLKSKDRMKSDVWATDVEISACCHLFNICIFTYNGDGVWDSFGNINNPAIYLDHSSDDHYNIVIRVKPFIGHTGFTQNIFGFFKPLSHDQKVHICSIYDCLKVEELQETIYSENIYVLQSIPSDRITFSENSSFFKSLSYSLLNTHEKNEKIKKFILDHMHKKECKNYFNKALGLTYKLIEEHLKANIKNKVNENMLITSLEISAACHLFEISILCYNNNNSTWETYGSPGSPAIYLEFSSEQKYSVVTNVKQVEMDSNILVNDDQIIQHKKKIEELKNKPKDINDVDHLFETLDMNSVINNQKTDNSTDENEKSYNSIYTQEDKGYHNQVKRRRYSNSQKENENSENETVKIVQGSISQMDDTFQGIGYGNNCVMNCLAFILKHYLNDDVEINTAFVDDSLYQGIIMYRQNNCQTFHPSGYIDLQDLQNSFVSNGETYIFDYTSDYTVLKNRSYNNKDIYDCISQSLKNYSACLITYANATSCIYKRETVMGQEYFLFDPHQRDCAGKHKENGKAIVFSSYSLKSLISKIWQTASSLIEENVIETTQVNIDSINIHHQKPIKNDEQIFQESSLAFSNKVEPIEEMTDVLPRNSFNTINIDLNDNPTSANSTVFGTMSQNNPIFEGIGYGVNCVMNCMMFLLKNYLDSSTKIDSEYVDDTLIQGIELYRNNSQKVKDKNGYLYISDLDKTISYNNENFNFLHKIYDTVFEFWTTENIPRLEDILKSIFLNGSCCFITIGHATSCIYKRNTMNGMMYCLFDPHCRNENAQWDENGKAIIITSFSLSNIVSKIWQTAQSLLVDLIHETSENPITIESIDFIEKLNSINLKNDSKIQLNSNQSRNELMEIDCEETSVNISLSSSDDCLVIRDEIDITSFGSFNPLSNHEKEQFCKSFNLKMKKSGSDDNNVCNVFLLESRPSRIFKITGDGACFFRALSQSISNTQNNHLAIRKAIVNHMQKAECLRNLRSSCGYTYRELQNHLATSNMILSNTWATSLEIATACHLFSIAIYTYERTGRWTKFGVQGHPSIYLDHSSENHYDVVMEIVNNDSFMVIEDNKMTRRQKYKIDESFRKNELNRKKLNYRNDENYRLNTLKRSIDLYQNDKEYRDNVKKRSTEKYRNDEEHREDVKKRSTEKYQHDEEYREDVKKRSTEKYQHDEEHREDVKKRSTTKYQNDEEHREDVKKRSTTKYQNNPMHQEKVKDSVYEKRNEDNISLKNIDNTITKFRDDIKNGTEFVCSVCQRIFFKKQVNSCNSNRYDDSVKHCITEKYFHICSEECIDPCPIKDGPLGSLWICNTCNSHLSSKKVPPQAAINNLELPKPPKQLESLNTLERHLVSLHIPFIKMISLPKGGQRGINGPVTCVPSDVSETVKQLPRNEADDQLVRVKLKRKLAFKGHQYYSYVDKGKINEALEYLKDNNEHYKDIVISKDWNTDLEEHNEERPDENETSEKSDEAEIDDNITDNHGGGVDDTCLAPVDIGQDTLEKYSDIINLAPAEKNKPVKMFLDKFNEAKSFPTLFPDGKGTFQDERPEKLSLNRYVNCRLMNADNRFANNTEYIFYAQYLAELQDVLESVSIALRKSKFSSNDFSASDLRDPKALNDLFKSDQGYKFLKPVRGTPPYWQSTQKDLFAMIRQIGIPTWFCSFSSADTRWNDMLDTILRQQGNPKKSEDMTWQEKNEILRSNPVSVARMFDHRFHTFLQKVIMSPANPIGEVIDYFFRVEFQKRGSPHTHCLFWIKDAPKLDESPDSEVIEFVDKYVTCELPDKDLDEELYNIVKNVQMHSEKHSPSCKKKNTVCRFNFPRPVTKNTFITRPVESKTETVAPNNSQNDEITKEKFDEIMDKLDKEGKKLQQEIFQKKLSQKILEEFWKANNDKNCNFKDIDELYESLNIDQEILEQAFALLSKSTKITLKRDLNAKWINQYNKDLIRAWNGNIDIQYITDAYACVVYIVSYISKAEREMGILLSQAHKEAYLEDNADAKAALKRISRTYLHHREISAQEAIYRACGLRLKECSRKVEFIPTGENRIRLTKPIKHLNENEMNDGNIWMTSINDRYLARPDTDEFNDMTLASFVSNYRVIYGKNPTKGNEKRIENKVLELKNSLGYIQKRSRGKPAIIRYARFSKMKMPEEYYRSQIELFMPYRNAEEMKPEEFATYEAFYNNGHINIDNELYNVKDIVESNKSLFEKDGEKLDKAEEDLNEYGIREDAWANLCPENERERYECEKERSEKEKDNDNEDENESQTNVNIPDLATTAENEISVEKMKKKITDEEGISLLRSLNTEQTAVFYKVREWCINKMNNPDIEPIRLFLTGEGGCGKSHVIKSIYYEATRLFSRKQENPDEPSVILTAPTGVASFNIMGTTLHSAFNIGLHTQLPYRPLSEDKINTLRAKYSSLQIVIIDEISMVSHKLLTYIHGRLKQIKRTPDRVLFGDVSIIAVGDFYQLRPVKAIPLYKEYQFDFWNNDFEIFELTANERQSGDKLYANILNKLRVRKKNETFSEEYTEILRSRENGGNQDSLHIYATRNQVEKFNIAEIKRKCTDIITIDCHDFSQDPRSGKLTKRNKPYKNIDSFLKERLLLADGARVQLTYNIEIPDGLVNGVIGSVENIDRPENDNEIPSKVYVKFDDDRVGCSIKMKDPFPGCIAIKPVEEKLMNRNGIRKQIPLVLSYACTVHKVQGLSMDKAVVSLAKIFTSGQGYVGLSRVTSLTGLTIEDFDINQIYCDESIAPAMKAMKRFVPPEECEKKHYNLILFNIEGLLQHKDDYSNDHRLRQTDFICFTETWINDDKQLGNIPHFRNVSRSQIFTDSGIFGNFKKRPHGGVGFSFNPKYLNIIPDSKAELYLIRNIEHIAMSLTDDLILVVVYRHPSFPIRTFAERLALLLDGVNKRYKKAIIMGDFNEDLNDNGPINSIFTQFQYKPNVFFPTTLGGTILDQVYTRNFDVVTNIIPTYFSYHDAVGINFKL